MLLITIVLGGFLGALLAYDMIELEKATDEI